MSRRRILLWLACAPALAQEAPAKRWERVEVEGVIRKVHVEPGRGMPSLELETSDGIKQVLLGSRRYLMENNFNPKAGSTAVVKGFRTDGEIVAKQIEIPSEKITLRLRTEDGVPLWRGGRRGGRR